VRSAELGLSAAESGGAVAHQPLFDRAIDSPAQTKKPPTIRPLLVTSISEAIILATFAGFIHGCYDWALHTSPRKEEWFGWAPQPARFWLLNLLLAPMLGFIITGFPLIVYFSLPRRFRGRFPLRLGFGGHPPLLGGAIFAGFAVLCIAAFAFLASFED